MRRFLFCALALLFGFVIQAQNISIPKSYYKDRINSLDPIEGQYDVENTVIGSVSGYGSQKGVQNMTWFVLKNDDYVVGRPSDFVVITEGYILGLIDRIGETDNYVLTALNKNGKEKIIRFQLNSLYSFSYSYTDYEIKNSRQGSSQVSLKAIKEYPTRSMYEEAFLNKAKSQGGEVSKPNTSSNSWSGSGFALNDGYLVTNYHVIDKATGISVYGVNGNFTRGYSASVVAKDVTNDLALLRITDKDFPGFGIIPYAINNQMIDVGEDVWVLGYPLTQVLGNEIKLTNGIVSSRSGYHGDVATYQISAPIQPGNSGGPLFDSKGNIVGIVNAGVPGAENVGYAVKTLYLKNLVDSYSLSSILPTKNSISSLSLKDQVKRVNSFVCLLMCSSTGGTNTGFTPNRSSSRSTLNTIDITRAASSSMRIDETVQLFVPGGIVSNWQSNDSSIASVDASGMVTGKKAGRTTIWATLSDGKLESYIITVREKNN